MVFQHGRWVRVLGVVCALLLCGGVAGLVVADEDVAPQRAPVEGDASAVVAALERTFAGPVRFTTISELGIEGMKLPAGIPAPSLSGHFDFAARRGTMTMAAAPGESVEQRVTETTTFFRAPNGMGRLRPGAWYAVGNDVLASELGETTLAGLSGPSFSAPDPRAAFEFVREQGVIRRVTREGADAIDGDRVTGYRLTLDQDAVQRRLADQQVLPRELAGAVTVTAAVVRVSVSAQGVARRSVLELRMEAGRNAVAVTVRTDYSDFGAPVHVEEPPAAEVVRLQSFREFEEVVRPGR